MRKIVLRIIVPALLVGYLSNASAQEVDSKVLNWYNNSKPGMSIDKAYKSLKNMTPDTVIVAIIDSGIDIDHEDLKGHIWTNKKEIAGNGIDDDGNGYIDDVNGWNFLGKPDGTNLEHARLDGTRTYARLKPKYEGVEEADVAAEDKKEYELYLKSKDFVETESLKYTMILEQVKQYKTTLLPMIPSMISQALGVDEADITLDKLKKWKAKTPQEKQTKQLGMAYLNGDLTEEVIDKQVEQIEKMIEYYYNPEFDDRVVIGDDYLDINDRDYGNNDVQGPDALHGTHVGGIVAAIRGNGLGGDGVANNVQLMSLRAVPDGDEFDKDIALAIRYAVDNGAKVINGSFGKGFSSLAKEVYEAIRYAEAHDVLFVHAAGNDAKDLDKEDNFPAVMYEFQKEPFTHLLTIGASTRVKKEKLPAVFSNYGANTVDIFAPGFEIYNTVPGNEYKKLQGTSMAAPMVSGVAALLKGYFPELSMLEIKNIILISGDDYSKTKQQLPGTGELVTFGELSRTGKVVNLANAVKLAKKAVKNKKK